MSEQEQVKSYQRRMASGKVVTVRAHQRTGADVATAARAMPGRPPLAAKAGQFAGGRSVPNVWVLPQPAAKPKDPKVSEDSAAPPDETAPPADAPIQVRDKPNGKVSRVVKASGDLITGILTLSKDS